MLTCKVGENIINCFDNTYDKYQLKKWSDKNILICPDCNKPYEYCHGEIITPYFRHKEKSFECDQIFSEPETEEHIKGKQILYKWLMNLQNKGVVSDVKLESYIPETKQRPDLSFTSNGNKFVFEFQCSPIATEYIERHRLYELAGIHDIWILGTDKYIEKSEVGKNYKGKAIEGFTNFYLDSEYKIFMFCNIEQLNLEDNYRIKSTYGYYSKDKRNAILSNLLVFDNNAEKYMIDMNGICFNKDKIVLTSEAINNIKDYSEIIIAEEIKLKKLKDKLQENINKCELFLKNVFKLFKKDYFTEFDWMRCTCGFKCSKHYYQFMNIENYPIIDFCKLDYTNNTPVPNLIFQIDIENDKYIKIIEYLKTDLKNRIELNIEFNDRKIKQEERDRNELIRLKQKLSQFNNVHLLFSEDDKKVDIRFKMIHDYPDNIIDLGKIVLNNLEFLKSKGVKEYVLMIPKKKIRESKSGSMLYPYYKVRNYKYSVREEFKELGINFSEI